MISPNSLRCFPKKHQSVAFPTIEKVWSVECNTGYKSVPVKKSKKKAAKYQTQPYPDQNGQNYDRIIVAQANVRCA